MRSFMVLVAASVVGTAAVNFLRPYANGLLG